MKRRIRITLLASLLFATVLTSCRKEPLDLVNPNSRHCMTFFQQFESVWEGMDQGYVFWEHDTVDWDARYEEFAPVFQEFDTRPDKVTWPEYQKAWEGVFEGLLDHHLMALMWNPKGGFMASASPGRNDYGHWTNRNAQLNALKKQPGIMYYSETEPNQDINPGMWFCLLPGKESGKYIAYFRFSDFSFQQMHYYEERGYFPSTSQMLAPVYAFYGRKYYEGMQSGDACWANNDQVESLIIDVRGNGGGSLADISPLVGSLLQQHYQVGYTRVKEGLGRLDYSAWMPFIIENPAMHITTMKPMVVLADINSASCAEITTQIIKMQSNGTFIGERTYGATCPLWTNSDVQHDIFYNGCFGDYDMYKTVHDGSLPTDKKTFAYYVYTSNFEFVSNDYELFEGVGVKPDIEVLYDAQKLAQGIDTQLDRALEFLRTGK